ncbi:MAG TPA: N-acetylneuraminate synthase family protein [Vicinamibacterales bacterium]|nr:N-acetylneuraminate synthase family protein [Vicinamibacterales bacterium]
MPRERPFIEIAGRRIAADVPPYVVAEIGLNHGGSLDQAIALVGAAAGSGAHAVKLQTLIAAELVSAACPAPAHVGAASLVDFFAQFEIDEAGHHAVVRRARDLGLAVIATPLSEPAVDLLERVGVDAFKIASGDLTWDALIARCASTGRPLIISTGLATLAEAAHAVDVARRHGAERVALLHCVSAYPVPRGSENLAAIGRLAELGVPVGLSDHGGDAFAFPIAVALGASIYERHLVLSDDHDAVDRAVSSTPQELADAIEQARRAWTALGSGDKACLAAEAPNLLPSRRSLHAARDLTAGCVLAAQDLVVIRPASGLPPAALPDVVGRPLAAAIDAGQPLLARHLGAEAPLERDRVA